MSLDMVALCEDSIVYLVDCDEGEKIHVSDIGKPERATQSRVVKLFGDELGYRYLGDRADCADNSNIEEGLLNRVADHCGLHPAADQDGVAQTAHGSHLSQASWDTATKAPSLADCSCMDCAAAAASSTSAAFC